ncbi:MAG: MBL fold metallo-hydrolase [Candidatus Aminicenantes bacterium]|nr:MBL fold metallo-hydrolase [Candidatus Aminicenantes bacterium]
MFKMTFSILCLVPMIGFCAQTTPPPKPSPPQPEPMIVEHIAGGLYFVKGGVGANTAFYVGEKDVTVFDAKMTAEAAGEMLAEIAKVTSKPVADLIITHSDLDHVNGLTGFPKTIKPIVSETTKKEMEEAFQDEKMAAYREYQFAPPFKGRTIFHTAGGESFTLIQAGPAHTGGDTVIVFPKEKAAFIGDLAFIGRDPLIHRAKGGTAAGYIASLKMMIEMDGVETYLSGHADALTKTDLQALLSTLEEKTAKVKALIAEGKTLEDVKAALLPPASPGAPPSRWPSFVEVVYLDLTEKK